METLFLALIGLLLAGMAFHGTQDKSTLSFPAWIKDYTNREHVLPGGIVLNKTAFSRRDAVTATATAIVAQGATAIPVTALKGPIPNGTVLSFGGAKVAVLTAAAATGATSLAVAALPTALAANDTATYAGIGKLFVPAATLVGRTYAEQAAKTPFGPWAANDDEVFLVIYDVPDLTLSAEADVLRPDTLVATNLLPGFDTRPAGEKAAIRSTYKATIGQP